MSFKVRKESEMAKKVLESLRKRLTTYTAIKVPKIKKKSSVASFSW